MRITKHGWWQSGLEMFVLQLSKSMTEESCGSQKTERNRNIMTKKTQEKSNLKKQSGRDIFEFHEEGLRKGYDLANSNWRGESKHYWSREWTEDTNLLTNILP